MITGVMSRALGATTVFILHSTAGAWQIVGPQHILGEEKNKFKKAFQDANESEGFINLILIQLRPIRLVLANCHVLLSAHVTTDYNILQSQSELMKWPLMNLVSLNLIVDENQISFHCPHRMEFCFFKAEV